MLDKKSELHPTTLFEVVWQAPPAEWCNQTKLLKKYRNFSIIGNKFEGRYFLNIMTYWHQLINYHHLKTFGWNFLVRPTILSSVICFCLIFLMKFLSQANNSFLFICFCMIFFFYRDISDFSQRPTTHNIYSNKITKIYTINIFLGNIKFT